MQKSSLQVKPISIWEQHNAKLWFKTDYNLLYFFGATLAVSSDRSRAAAVLKSPSSYIRWNSRYLPKTQQQYVNMNIINYNWWHLHLLTSVDSSVNTNILTHFYMRQNSASQLTSKTALCLPRNVSLLLRSIDEPRLSSRSKLLKSPVSL